MENTRKRSGTSELQWRSLPRSLGLRFVLDQGNFRGLWPEIGLPQKASSDDVAPVPLRYLG